MGKTQPGERQARSLATLAAFVFGVPLAVGLLAVLQSGLLGEAGLHYVKHPVECVEVLLFSCALAALATKLWLSRGERAAHRHDVLPAWDGQPVPATEATTLRNGVRQLGRRLQGTYLGRRVAAVLDFVSSRGSAAELDDQLRTLADNDAIALEGSYALVRFITWAIPILGFLGTVLGITKAIAGVTPDVLENSISGVTDGLAEAFDCTALALALTMIVMFLSYLTERVEQSALESVDHFVDGQLAHRFERVAAQNSEFVEVVRQNGQAVVNATEQLVRRQAAVWSEALTAAQRRWDEAGQRQQDLLAQALEAALLRTLEQHQERLAAQEQQSQQQGAALLGQLTALAGAIRETGREHQATLLQLSEHLAAQTQALAQLQTEEKQLVRLQETLQQNLQALAGAGAFEQMLHGLTGAVHLLTARLGGVSPGNRLGPRNTAA
jgi:hypothetical protein